MSFLDPIYSTDFGTVYAIQEKYPFVGSSDVLQVQIADIAIIMSLYELKTFLKVIRTAKRNCNCINCRGTQILKCKTHIAEIKLNVTQTIISDLEELILGTLFHKEYISILDTNGIN